MTDIEITNSCQMTGYRLYDIEESPFDVNGRQWAWDTITINWLKDCPRKYKYFMLDGWTPAEPNLHQHFGWLYAKALEKYHIHRTVASTPPNIAHKDALRNVIIWLLQASYPWSFDDSNKSRENLIRSVIWYLEKFRDDPCKTILLQEGNPAVELATRMQLNNSNILIVHLDRIVNFNNHNYIQDQKTTKNTITSYYFDSYNLDNQMSIYSVVGSVVYKAPIAGVMIDAAQVAVGFTKYERGFTYRTKEQLNETLKDILYYIGPYRDLAEKNDWPMNDTACNKFRSSDPYGNARGCPLRDVCGKDPRVREKFLESNFVKKQWNPLEERK